MTDKKSVACIGAGFVGGSLTTVLSEKGVDVYTYDISGKYKPGSKPSVPGEGVCTFPSSVKQLVESCQEIPGFSNIYFVCLPTPMQPDGSADLSIVEGVLKDLASIPGRDRIAVIKSTVPPGSTQMWNEMFKESGLHVIFNPEFLRETSALDDMRNQDRIVLGGPRPWINEVRNLFQSAFPEVPIIKTSSTTAEMVKYVTNVHLTVKVALANELCQICEALNSKGLDIDYDKVIEYATLDKRLGNSHWHVPGPDGHRGYGGSCFVKDLNALMRVASLIGVNPLVMHAAWNKNLEVRPEKDWLKLLGRAVSDPNKKP